MKKKEDLPHLCQKRQIWTKMKGSALDGNLLKQSNQSKPITASQLTGNWGLQRKEVCEKPFLACGSDPPAEASAIDRKILTEAKIKHESNMAKIKEKKKAIESFIAVPCLRSNHRRREILLYLPDLVFRTADLQNNMKMCGKTF